MHETRDPGGALMNAVRKVAGAALILGAMVLGFCVGIWICLVGGIMDVADGVKAVPTDMGMVVWGLAKALILSVLSGAAAIWGFGLAGGYLLVTKKKTLKDGRKTISL